MGDLSLYKLSLWKTAWLLKNSFWNESSPECNPFSTVPSCVVDDLIKCVLQLTTSGSLKVTDLYHLLSSGRVEHLKLDDILMSSEEFVSIIMTLSVACTNLKSLTLRSVYFSDYVYQQTKVLVKKVALECLVSCAAQLELLESCVEFELKSLRKCRKLKVLRVNFVTKCRLCDFLEEGESSSLQSIEAFEDARNTIPFVDIVPILQRCPNLLHANLDVSRALDYLHGDEMLLGGTLQPCYSLQRCLLGSAHLQDGAATVTSVRVATLTCPRLREVEMLASEHDAVSALENLHDLRSLLLQWDAPEGGDFRLSALLLLQKVGYRLRSLSLINFRCVDFASIAAHCPQLEELRVDFLSEHNSDSTPHGFSSLETLHLETLNGGLGCSERTLSLLLEHSNRMRRLHLHNADGLTDNLLQRVVQKGGLAGLKDAVLLDCSLSADGIRQLAEHLLQLEYLHMSSSRLLFEEAAAIVHSVNPLVIMLAES